MKSAITTIFLVFLFLTTSFVSNAQLTGMTPTQGNIGQNLAVTIFGNNIFDGSSGPGGNIIQMYLQKGNDYLIMYDNTWGFSYPNIVDPNTVQTALIMNPTYTQPGIYDLYVITTDPNDPNVQLQFTVPSAFTVNAPTGSISGNIYKDLNRNGVKDAGEPDLAGETVRIVPSGSNAFFAVTDASGNYSFSAYNVNYSVTYLSSTTDWLFPTSGIGTYNITINNNNSAGNNFGVNGALLSVTPNVLEKGSTTVHTVTSNRPIFHPGTASNGNITSFTILSSPLFTLPLSSVSVIDSFTVQFTISTPTFVADATAADLRLNTSSGNVGTHYLRGQLTIVPPPTCDPPDSTWAQYVTASSFRVNWTPVPNAYRYQIYYKVGGTATWTQRSVAGNKTFMGIQNLNCGTNYRWKVRTVCQTATGTIKSAWTTVKVTTTLACAAEPSDRMTETESETVSVDVFPNPASEFIAIEAGSEISGATELELYNLTGALVMKKSIELQSGETIEINVNEVPEGLYFIRMNGAVNHTSKILIQR